MIFCGFMHGLKANTGNNCRGIRTNPQGKIIDAEVVVSCKGNRLYLVSNQINSCVYYQHTATLIKTLCSIVNCFLCMLLYYC